MIHLDDLFALHRGGQTEFQNERFVTVRAGGTPYGCFVQALRELWKRFRGLVGDFCQRETLLIDIDELEIQSEDQSFDGRRARAKLRRLRLALIETEKHIETDSREFLQFYAQAAAIYSHLGFDREPPTQERIEQLDRERWEHRALCGLALDCLQGGPTRTSMELAQCLPTATREKILRRAFGPSLTDRTSRERHAESLIQWYLNYTPDLPEPLALTAEQTAALLSSCESGHLPAPLRLSLATDAGASRASSLPGGSRSASPATDDAA